MISKDKVNVTSTPAYQQPSGWIDTALMHSGKRCGNMRIFRIWRLCGTTVDTSDMEKELSVLSARLHQAEAIKTRIEQQMDSLDVNTPHYEKKIADLQRRLDSQYDTIDEVEQAITEVRAQILMQYNLNVTR